MTPFELTETDRLLTTTRAVRKRLDLSRPVEPDVLLDCLRIATQAPTGGNSQRWRWLVVQDPAKKSMIAGAYRRVYAGYIGGQRARVADGDQTTQRVMASSDYLAERLQDVPALVIPCTLDQPTPGVTNMELAGIYGGILPAVWSFQLALRSRGLGSAFTTLHLGEERAVGEALAIPPTVLQVALIPVAYVVGDDFRPAERRPIEEITYWDEWKRTERPT